MRKKPLPPRFKRMNRKRRLQSAKHWLKKYNGKNVARGYRKHYGVDMLCAIKGLQMLGVKLDPAYVEQVRHSVQVQAMARRKRKEGARLKEIQDDNLSNRTNFSPT